MLQSCVWKSFNNTENPSASAGGGVRTPPYSPLSGLCPGPADDLKRSPEPSSNFVPPNTNPGSVPDFYMYPADNKLSWLAYTQRIF